MSSSRAKSEQLKALSAFLRTRFSSLTDAFVALDVSNKHQIALKNFTTGLRKMGFSSSELENLYHSVDQDGVGAISLPMFLAALEQDGSEPAVRTGSEQASRAPRTVAPSNAGPSSPSSGMMASPSATACGRAHRTPPAVHRQASGPSRGLATSPSAVLASGPRILHPEPAHCVGSGRGGRPIRSQSSDAVNRRPHSLAGLATSASMANYGSIPGGSAILHPRHLLAERAVPTSPAKGGATSREPVFLQSPLLAGGSPRLTKQRVDGSPGPPILRATSHGPNSYVASGSLNLQGSASVMPLAGGSLNLSQLNTGGAQCLLTPRTVAREPSSPFPHVGLGSVPAPNQAWAHDHRSMLEQVGTLKAQLAAECMERQIDCRALRVAMDDNLRQLRREVGEKTREEVQSCTGDARSSLRRELEEHMMKAISTLGVKLDGLSAQLRATSEETEDARRNLEAQVMERCDRLNDLLTASSVQTETRQRKLEQDMVDVKARLVVVEASPLHQEHSTRPSTPKTPSNDIHLATAFEQFNRATEKRLADMEKEMERSLGFNVLVEGRIASLQESLTVTMSDRVPSAAEHGKPLDTLTENPMDDRVDSLERQLLVLSEQTEAAQKHCEEAVAALKAQLPVDNTGDFCTMADVQRLLPAGELCTMADVQRLLPAGELCTMADVQKLLPLEELCTMAEMQKLLPAGELCTMADVQKLLPAGKLCTLEDVQKLLPPAERGSLCTLSEVQDLLQENMQGIGAELESLKSQFLEREDSMRRVASKDQLGDVIMTLDRRLQLAETEIVRCVSEGKEAATGIQALESTIRSSLADLTAEQSKLEEKVQHVKVHEEVQPAQDASASMLDLEKRVQAAEESVAKCVQSLEDQLETSSMVRGQSCTLQEVESLVEASLVNLTTEVQRLGKEDSLLEVGLATLRGEIEKLCTQDRMLETSLATMRSELDKSVNQDTSQDLGGTLDMDTISAIDRRLQAGEEELGRAVSEWRSAMVSMQDKLCSTLDDHLREQEKLLKAGGLGPTCTSTLEQWATAAMPCLASLTKPPPRPKAKRKMPTSPSASSAGRSGSGAGVSTSGATAKRSPRISTTEVQQPGPQLNENSDSQVNEIVLDSHLLNVISTLRAEVRRLREEQGVTVDTASSGAGTPSGASSTAASFPSSKVLPVLGQLQLSPTGMSSINSGPLASFSEFKEHA